MKFNHGLYEQTQTEKELYIYTPNPRAKLECDRQTSGFSLCQPDISLHFTTSSWSKDSNLE